MHLQSITVSLAHFLPPPSSRSHFVAPRSCTFRKTSIRCSLSKPLPAEVSRTIMELSSVGTLSTITKDHWPLGVGVRFAVDPEGTPILCLNQSSSVDSKSSLHVQGLTKMWIFGRKGPSGFSAYSTAEEVTQGIDGTGLIAIVTGASSGIGVETTRVLALRGVHVVMAVRNVEAGKNVRETILKENSFAKIDVMELDLSSLASVRKFASDYNSLGLPLNLLINNAGVMATPYLLSQDGIEFQFATNHLGHFLLTNLLLETLKNTAHQSNREGRIINVSSEAHRRTYSEGIQFDKINDQSSYSTIYAYGQSKLSNILHANELTRRLKEDGVEITANSLHPGVIVTNLFRYHSYIEAIASLVSRFVFKNVQQGAATTCYVALHPQVKGVSGEYFTDSNIAKPSSKAKDETLAKKLWDFSLSLTSPK